MSLSEIFTGVPPQGAKIRLKPLKSLGWHSACKKSPDGGPEGHFVNEF